MAFPVNYFGKVGPVGSPALTPEEIAALVAEELARGGWVQVPDQPVYDPQRAERCLPCPASCDLVFDRVVVSYLIRGGTRVMWELHPNFTDPQPYIFQLQAGQSANPEASDWVDVGLPMANTYYAVDGEQRMWGKHNFTHYRVKLYTSKATYFSLPTAGLGTLDARDWRLARETLRQQQLRLRLHAGQEGLLLKRRLTGAVCTVCVDTLTGETRQHNCQYCWGTGFQCGYFFPISCVWAEIEPKTYRIQLSGDRGTTSDIAVRARMANTWLLSEEDIWVNRKTDERYYVHSVQNVAEFRGIPLVAAVELRPAPFSDVAYDIPLP